MPIKSIYLTIDDAPSVVMPKKVEFLLQHKIPALFFCRGEFIASYKQHVVEAIAQGFLIGNHSYSHPYFSKVPLASCFEEIVKTEALIMECYQKAKVPRPVKVIRLPFGDRGAGGDLQEAIAIEEEEKVFQIQIFLKENGFVPLILPFCSQRDEGMSYIDVEWDWDTSDYQAKLIKNPEAYRAHLLKHWDQSLQETETILLHDFTHSHHLFEITMDFLLGQKVQFLPFPL
ncbi:MAG: polysaccharide deacetylase family protein [Oligoflexia bacterium]|nr:polysaccharide deacetylase family protein [Oligoflexia bacterium]MBF0364662.1 polysaccharide deacetylase family protein [Oligoflexia bacterium]